MNDATAGRAGGVRETTNTEILKSMRDRLQNDDFGGDNLGGVTTWRSDDLGDDDLGDDEAIITLTNQSD
jgi:hypothetical protein